jgi:hypothetical protein
MASFLTSDQYRDRILGKSESSSVPNRAMMLMTGNNLTLTGDMARRVLVARINPETDRPFAREFRVDPLSVCIAHRQQMIAAALTLIRYYLGSKADRPGKGRMASFEGWDDWVRQTTIYIGTELAQDKFGDVMEQIQLNQANDPEQESLGALLQAIWLAFEGRSFSASDVLEKGRYDGLGGNHFSAKDQLSNALDEYKPRGGDLSAKSLGKVLKFRKDRIVGGLSLKFLGESKGTGQWRLQRSDASA